MRKLFKNFNILGLVAFVAAGIMAISWTEMKVNEEALWYEVEITDLDHPEKAENQKIKGLYPGPNPGDAPTGECSDGLILCAVQLDFDSSIVPATMEEAETDPDVEIKARKHKD